LEFHLEVPETQFYIRSVSEKGIRISDDYYNDPLVISDQQLLPDWNAKSVEDIDEENLQLIFELQPEVVIIGTGKTQVFLPLATQAHFYRRNIGFEVMSTDAACRTFNVLVSEGRRVVAALLPIIS
jgi:uncharacterized protein